MKKNIFMIGAALMLLTGGGCSDNEQKQEPEPVFSVSPLVVSAKAGTGTYILTVTADEDWTVLTDFGDNAGWCTLNPTSGTGNGEITVSVTPNPQFLVRSTMITVTAGDKVRYNKVLQTYPELGPDEVLINGIIWATRNVGELGQFTSAPDVQGKLYQFNRKEGYPATGAATPANWPATYTNDNTDWLPENDPCPEGWRTPTAQELQDAWNIGATWKPASATGYAIDGVVMGITPAEAATATKNDMKGGIFLPKSGWRTETGALDRDWLCAISSGTQDGTKNGRVMPHRDSGSYNCPTCGAVKPWAVAVRCVKDIQ